MSRRTRTNDLLPAERRLLHDLAVVQTMIEGERLPARQRLELELGDELTRLLCSSLAPTAAKAA
jgi:hypothetical protein